MIKAFKTIELTYMGTKTMLRHYTDFIYKTIYNLKK